MSTGRKIVDGANAATRKLNPHLYAPAGPGYVIADSTGKPFNFAAAGKSHGKVANDGKPPKRLRQSSKPLMNKLEAAWLAELERRHPGVVIWKQALRWKLGNGIWYKVDFAAFVGWTQKPTELTCWEVKGPHAFRGGFENLKVAASLYPEVRWVLVWKDKATGAWQEQEVLP